MNIVVSNVRGPDLPIYMAGAQMVAFAPVSIALDGLGLNVTGFSYHGSMWVCAVACREMIPDPGFFAECMREAFADLVAAADALPAAQDTSRARPAARARPRAAEPAQVRKKQGEEPASAVSHGHRSARRKTAAGKRGR